MPPNWRFLLDRGVNFRTKRELLAVSFPAVYQLADVGLTGLATDLEIFAEAQQRRLILITKDTDFLRQGRYALGPEGIPYVTPSPTARQDTVTAGLGLADRYSLLEQLRFTIRVSASVSQ